MARKLYLVRRGWLLIGMLLMPVFAWSEVTVIFDSGNTRPLVPYLEILEGNERSTNRPSKSDPKLGAADIQSLLPIRSPGFTPGFVLSRKFNRPFARPFFLIGSDQTSRLWLIQHRQRLKAIGAVGLLVQADTIEDMQVIARLADGLPVSPASGADIARALGVSHYPVLVTSQGIEQ